MNSLFLEKIVYTFSQECNTNGTTGRSDDSEILEITVESVLKSIHEQGGFMVIRTNGWSFNDIKEIKEVVSIIENGVGSNVKVKWKN